MDPSAVPDHFVEMDEAKFLSEATRIVETAKSKGVVLRVLGALAVYSHSIDKPECIDLFRSLVRFENRRQVFTDLDLAGYSRQRNEIGRFLEGMNFKSAGMVNVLFGNRRLLYFQSENKYQVDVFLDKLEFSHDVLFGDKPGQGRLELDSPTITLADVVLEKLQIHTINRKDLVDLTILLVGHELDQNSNPNDKIDIGYVAGTLSRDWGFWYDAVTNLNNVKSFASEQAKAGKLTDGQFKLLSQRVDQALSIIEQTPKSKDWLKRSKNGTNKPWYKEVEEMTR